MRVAPALLLVALPAALDAGPRFALPLDCTLGEDCFVMNYVDADPGPEAADFACGPITYDGHEGTDFALTSFAAMRAGVAVRAAAPGVVRGLRDGMPDLGLEGTPADALAGRDCGNGVAIDHGGGWESQYCHLAEGSIAVREGDRVAAGTVLGAVGYSGRTGFPHVHLALRRDGVTVDPFDPDGRTVCGAGDGPADHLWTDPPDYRPGGVVSAGVFPGVPDYDVVKDGTAHEAELPGDAPALVGWGLMHGVHAGDRAIITLTAPDGTVLLRHEETLERTQALVMRAAGRKRPGAGWAAGDWRVTVDLVRDGAVLDRSGAVSRVPP